MISKVDPLQMLIGFTMQLTVGLEVCLVAAESTRVVVVVHNNDELLREAKSRAILVDVRIQFVQIVCVEV